MTHDDLDYTLSCLRRSVENGSAGTLYPAGAAALVAEVERLRAEVGMLQQEARIRKNLCDGLASEVAEERAAVVAWLLAGTADCRACMDEAVVRLAREIERGEHRREEE